jgi:hypothetical protein
MMEGSGSGAGSVPPTSGSGSKRPKTSYGSDGSGSATLLLGNFFSYPHWFLSKGPYSWVNQRFFYIKMQLLHVDPDPDLDLDTLINADSDPDP